MVFTDLISIPGVPSHLNYQAGYTKGYTTGFKVRTEASARAVALSAPCAPGQVLASCGHSSALLVPTERRLCAAEQTSVGYKEGYDAGIQLAKQRAAAMMAPAPAPVLPAIARPALQAQPMMPMSMMAAAARPNMMMQ